MQGKKLFVGNLTYSVTSDELGELFASYGEVVEAKVIEGKGFGFGEMASQEEAVAAKDALHGTEFVGRTLNVDEARPPRNRGPRRSY